MFEFFGFSPSDDEHGRHFIADWGRFLGRLPKAWPYDAEVWNWNWLKPEY